MRSRLRRRSDWRIRSQPGSSPGWWRGFRWNISSYPTQIITYAKNNIGLKLHQSIYLTLTDHISFAIERYKKGMQFDNPLKVEVKTFYPIEFGVGKYAIRKVREKLDVELNEDEAASRRTSYRKCGI